MKHTNKSAFPLACILLLCACGTEKTETTDATDTATDRTAVPVTEKEEPDSAKELLGTYDFGGEVYRILGREYAKLGNMPSYEFDTELENGDIINDTIYTRNRTVEELYNVVITAEQVPDVTPVLTKSQMANDCAYDLVWAHIVGMSGVAAKGLLSNFYDIPVIDLTAPWWNQLATESLTVNDRCYLQMNYIPFTGVLLSHCLYFNKAIAADYDIAELYTLVSDNQWTFDTFSEISKRVSGDLDGSGDLDEKDLYGLLCSHGTSGAAFSVAMGTKAIRINDDNTVTLTMLSDKNQSILDKIVDLTRDPSTYMITDYAKENELAIKFAAGEALFYSGFMSDSYQFFRDMEDDWGMLPFPKYDESQAQYITTVTGGTGLLGIPKLVKNEELVGVVTEALAIESLYNIYPAVYETVFEDKLMRDENSLLMFELLLNGLEIDFGRTFKNAAYTDMMCDLVAKGSTDLASTEKKLAKAAQKHYESILAFYNEEP